MPAVSSSFSNSLLLLLLLSPYVRLSLSFPRHWRSTAPVYSKPYVCGVAMPAIYYNPAASQ